MLKKRLEDESQMTVTFLDEYFIVECDGKRASLNVLGAIKHLNGLRDRLDEIDSTEFESIIVTEAID